MRQQVKKFDKFKLKSMWLLILLSGSLSFLHAQQLAPDNEFSVLSKRIVVDFESSEPLPADPAKDGRWTDINYKDTTHSSWQPAKHWDRILLMSKSYYSHKGTKDQQASLLRHIGNAMNFWFIQKPVCPNYWWNAIGVPLRIGEALLLTESGISAEQKASGIELMKVGIKKDFYDYHGIATGQNAIWLSTVHLMMGVLLKDVSIIQRASTTIAGEIVLTTGEGIQHDYSFHQHGALLYSGGYGLSFARDVTKLLTILNGTRYEISPEKIKIFSSYVLEGLQWMVYQSTVDYSTLGREIARMDERKRTETILSICTQLASLNLPRSQEFKTMASRVNGESQKRLTGNRYFWRSDFMTHYTDKFYTSIKMASSRLKATETGNNENLKAWYLGQGVQFILRNGYEYQEIFPVWDWQKLPGHLAEQTAGRLQLPSWGRGAEGRKAFTGGISDGRFGLAANDYEYNNVKAKRAWFCFDKEIVCLGAGITCETDNPLIQVVNQCLQKGDVVANTVNKKSATQTINKGELPLSGLQWLYHDSIAYFFLKGKNVTVKNDIQTGSWRDINNQPQYPNDTIKKQVFSAWINLGKQAKNESYNYIIVPGISAADAMRYNLSVKVLRNDSSVQAVTHIPTNITMAAFYKAGSLVLDNKMKITVNQPVLFMVKENKGHVTISLSNPENKGLQVGLTVNRKLDCDNCKWSKEKNTTTFSVNLPSGSYAGQTVSKQLSE